MADPMVVSGPLQIRRRAAGGALGAPAALKSGEFAVNFADGWVYLGFGDDGSGNATSILKVGGSLKFVELAGDQTIGGTKTFQTSPLVPHPAAGDDSQRAATTGWVLDRIEGYGAGDMMKSTYDPDNDGKVVAAQSADVVPWTGVSGKPTQFPPAPFDAGLISSGTVDPARLPAALFAAPVVSSAGIAGLTAGQQNEIVGGTHVVTSDGRHWVYKGAGSKTDEASYVELGDRTPDFSAIANRPTTLAGYGITDAQPRDATLTALAALSGVANKGIYFTGDDLVATFDLTAFARQLLDDGSAEAARLTLALGTLATQNANNVSITGGTIAGVTASGVWDGGTF